MTNKLNYDVTFQYDYYEENPKKFSDGRIKRAMAAHDGVFLDDYNNYGIKDINFTITATAETLKTIAESVLKDAERCDIRMAFFAKRKFDLVLLNVSELQDRDSLIDEINSNKEVIGFKKFEVSKHNNNELVLELFQNTDKNEALAAVQKIIINKNVTEVFLYVSTVDAMNLDNYNTRKKSSLDY